MCAIYYLQDKGNERVNAAADGDDDCHDDDGEYGCCQQARIFVPA
jgi:hypothetical protein